MPIYGSKLQNLGGQKKFDKDFWKRNLWTQSPARCPQGVAPPLKMVPPYSLGTCPPTTPSHFDASSLLHWENIDFLKTPDFGQSSQMALESPKIDICQNGPQGALGDVSSCLETKFDKKMSMGSVPNCWKEIANRYGIRWFKCKLKLPKNICQWHFSEYHMKIYVIMYEPYCIKLFQWLSSTVQLFNFLILDTFH